MEFSVTIFVALIAASSAIIGAVITQWLTSRREQKKHDLTLTADREKWLREQRQNCYHNAVKYLIRIKSIGARVKQTSAIKIPENAPSVWYDDIAEANAWLSSLQYYCSDTVYDDVGEVASNLFNLSSYLIGSPPNGISSQLIYRHVVDEEGFLDYGAFTDEINQMEVHLGNLARRDFARI